LLAAFQPGEGLDLIRESVRLVYQELTAERSAEPDGHRSRVLTTKAGEADLAIPKLRRGGFLRSILEPQRRIDQALYAVVMEAYVHGVSTRSVDELVEAMGSWSGSQSPRSAASVAASTSWWRPAGSAGSNGCASPTSGWMAPT
jgi:transposase-like protein